MTPFISLTSVAAPLPEGDVDTDIIFPARFLLLLNKDGLAEQLFHERRRAKGQPRFVLDTPPFDRAKILVTGENFGCGSSREQAAWAIADFGVRAILAPSFGEIFFNNCLKNGVLPIVMDRPEHTRAMKAASSWQRIEAISPLSRRGSEAKRLGSISQTAGSKFCATRYLQTPGTTGKSDGAERTGNDDRDVRHRPLPAGRLRISSVELFSALLWAAETFLDHQFLETAPIGRSAGRDDDSTTVMTGLVPVIYVVQLPETLGTAGNGATWMAGNRGAGIQGSRTCGQVWMSAFAGMTSTFLNHLPILNDSRD